MKCKVCGAESGKYPLCRACNLKKDRGEIVKCAVCNNWHYTNSPCPLPVASASNDVFLYDAKARLMSNAERDFYHAIFASLPEGYHVFPQVNLATFITRTDDARYHNELFRNVDFLITDSAYRPRFVIEINDQTHLNYDRKERDEKVRKICEEAGVPILKLWTSYGVNVGYIKGRIEEFIANPAPARVHHFSKQATSPQEGDAVFVNAPVPMQISKPKKGCYVATCVYGSYDCPPVWVLRRYRDQVLENKPVGRLFIKVYYRISPWLVKRLGKKQWFVNFCQIALDAWVCRLQERGFTDTKYCD